MPATQAVEGFGSTLGSSPDNVTYTLVAEVSKITGPSLEGKEINASHLASPFGFEEFLPGMVNAGELTFEMNFTKNQAATLYAMFRTTNWWKVTLTTGSTWVCQGFIAKFGTETPFDDKISNSATIKLTGKPTYTA